MAVYLDCPKCGWPVNKVISSRPVDKGIRRRRVCEECGHRWTTYEFTKEEWMRRMNEESGKDTGIWQYSESGVKTGKNG